MNEDLQRPASGGGSKVGLFVCVALLTACVGTAAIWIANGGDVTPGWKPPPPTWRPTTTARKPAAVSKANQPQLHQNKMPTFEIIQVGNKRYVKVTTYHRRP